MGLAPPLKKRGRKTVKMESLIASMACFKAGEGKLATLIAAQRKGINGSMATIEKSVLVHFSAQQMFDLVRNVADYPKFLPWCGAGSVESHGPDIDKATVEIVFKGFRQSFCTLNQIIPAQAIHMTLVEGPFDHLQGHWAFQALTPDACKVSFVLDYEFSSKVLEQLVGPVFQSVANTVVDSFIRRAEAMHASSAGLN